MSGARRDACPQVRGPAGQGRGRGQGQLWSNAGSCSAEGVRLASLEVTMALLPTSAASFTWQLALGSSSFFLPQKYFPRKASGRGR